MLNIKKNKTDFNPTLGLILTGLERAKKEVVGEFQSYLRSDSDSLAEELFSSTRSYFNPTLGLILTEQRFA